MSYWLVTTEDDNEVCLEAPTERLARRLAHDNGFKVVTCYQLVPQSRVRQVNDTIAVLMGLICTLIMAFAATAIWRVS